VHTGIHRGDDSEVHLIQSLLRRMNGTASAARYGGQGQSAQDPFADDAENLPRAHYKRHSRISAVKSV
jgi:hypothetical protein